MTSLDVYLHTELVGSLERHAQTRLRFTYAAEWVEAAGPPLSLSLPVRPDPFSDDECRPFFEGLLPEGEFLKAIARVFHVSADNPFALLSEIGGECAGAVSLAPAGAPPPIGASTPPRWLSDEELDELLGDLPRRPLLAAAEEDDEGFRLSLAGTHDKLGVLFDGRRIGLTRGNPPSTHIVKTPIPRAPETVANEAFCMALAAQAGLPAVRAEPRSLDRHEYLLVRRFDRDPEAAPDKRIHQEDLCQALGLVPAMKYEAEGGPNVAACARLLRAATGAPARDLLVFLDALLFNFLIGNHDAHSKNYSLLLEGPDSPRLAPLYDLLYTSVYPGTSKKLAMKHGGEYRPAYVRGRHLDRLAADLELRPSLLRQRAAQLIERVTSTIEPARAGLPGAFQEGEGLDAVTALVGERAGRLSAAARESEG